jgi:hypothetical protein
MLEGAAEDPAECHHADEDQQSRGNGKLQPLSRAPCGTGGRQPEDQDGRHRQHPHGISDPPGGPDPRVVGPRGETVERERRDTDGGADHGAETGTEQDQGEDARKALHGLAIREPAAQQPHARHRGQGIPDRRRTREARGGAVPGVHGESPQRQAGQDSAAAQHDRSQGDPAGGPDEGHALVKGRQLEPQQAGQEVDCCQPEVLHHRAQAQLTHCRRLSDRRAANFTP